MYTVNQLARLAGVSARTLHHYDHIGLLKPAQVGENGYRYYDDQALLRLQQVLFFREMGLDLKTIKATIDRPDFDQVRALQTHRQALLARIERLRALIKTIDATILHLSGEIKMSQESIFRGFDRETEKRYSQEAQDLWGETARQSIRLWNSYSEEKKTEILKQGGEIYAAIVEKMHLGPAHEEVQALLLRWHEHLRHFYEPTIEVLAGLGQMYHDHPDFNATFTRLHPDLPAFLQKAIAVYVDNLRTQ